MSEKGDREAWLADMGAILDWDFERGESPPLLIGIDVRLTTFADDDFGLISIFKEQLTKLNVGKTQVRGPGLENLAMFTLLEELRLNENDYELPVGQWFQSLKCLPSLEYLDVSQTHLTDVDFSELGGLPIKYLVMTDNEVSDAGMAILPSFARLSHLYVHRNSITDEAVPFLAAAPALEYVNLCRTRVSDAGCRRLESLSQGRIKIDIE